MHYTRFIRSCVLLMCLMMPLGALASSFSVEINKGQSIRTSVPVASVVVANPDIADVQVITPKRLYVNGRSIGETSLIAVDENDRVIVNATITVTHNLSKLQQMIQTAVPGSQVMIDSTDNAIILNGSVASPNVAEKVQRIAASFLGQQQSVINMLNTAQGDQVMLQVKIAEVSRSELKRFGINLEALLNSGNFLFGLATGRDFVGATNGIVRNGLDNALYAGYSGGRASVSSIVDMMENDGLMTVLAEPNLTTKSGVAANFLAGGEFPIPVSGENNAVTIEYRPFGVSLDFTPVVLDERRISLTVSPEVSSISNANAVTANGFQIPSIITRRAATTVELGSGESFAIAGLLNRSDMNDMSKVPGLGNLPVLGALFRSSEFRQEQSELVIIVTPYIVRPVDTELATPLDGYIPASDMERILLGKLYHEPGKAALAQEDGRVPHLQGPAGFILR